MNKFDGVANTLFVPLVARINRSEGYGCGTETCKGFEK